MKRYYLFAFFFFSFFSLFSQNPYNYTEKEFNLPDPGYPVSSGINTTYNTTYKANESITLSDGFNYDARTTNKRFNAKIDLNLIFDVEIESGYSSNIFSPTNGRPLDDSKEVGKIPGNYSVDNVGGFNYIIPIQVPPGSNGVAPEISIAYSTNAQSGIMGLGWNLSGLSAISRTTKNKYYDDITEPLQLDDTDPYSLDGQRLIKDGSIYKTESENYAVVVPISVTADGPARWEVRSKDGTVIEYGNSADARISYGAKRISWLIKKVKDLNGNYISYKYRLVNGQNLIDEILYTGNSSNEPYNKIKFTYVKKQESVKRYFKGYESTDNYLIDKIITFSHNSPVYEYSMKYSYNSNNYVNSNNQPNTFTYQRPFLKEIILKSLIGGEEFHSTIFKYGDSKPAKNYYNIANDLVLANKSAIFNLGDFNNDGLTDVAEFGLVGNNYTSYANKLTYNRNNGDGSFTSLASNIPLTKSRPLDLTKHWDAFNKVIRSTDLDGNGEDDFLIAKVNVNLQGTMGTIEVKAIINKVVNTTNVMTFNFFDPNNFAVVTGDFTGDGVQDGIGYDKVNNEFKLEDYNSNNSSTIPSPVNSFDNLTSIDYDGDGTIELMLWKYNNANKIEYSIVDIRYLAGTFTLHDLGGAVGFPGITERNNIQVADFNNDGVSDLFLTRTDNSTAYSPVLMIGDGNGTYTSSTLSFNYALNDTWIFADLNSDGFSDFLRIYEVDADNTGVQAFYSNGNSISLYDYPEIPYSKILDNSTQTVPFTVHSLANYSLGDFDGNNSLELFYVLYTYTNVGYDADYSYTPVILELNGGPIANKLNAIRNGLNQDLEILYTYNSNPDEIFTYNDPSDPPSGTYQKGYITQDVQPTDGTIFLDQQVLLTKKINKSLAADISNYNKYDSTEKYVYSSAIFNKEGKGLIGMAMKQTTMPYQGKFISNSFKLDNSCSCLIPKKSSVYEYLSDNYLASIKYEETNYEHSIASLQGGKRFLIQQTQVQLENFVTGTDQTTDYTYFPSGNLKKTTIDNGVYESSVEIKSYGQFATTFAIHPTEIETISDNLSETGDHRVTTELDYYANGNLKEKIDIVGTGKETTSEYTYDNYGNVSSITTTAQGLPALTSSSFYDQYGQFVEITENAKGQKTHLETWKPFGLPLGVTTPNNNRMTYEYNGFGRKLSETAPDGITTTFELDWNATSGFDNKSLYYVKTNTPGQPEQKIVYDYLERPVYKEVDGWNDKIVSTTEYFYEQGKSIGLIKKQSLPKFSQNTETKYISYTYDKLQRLKEVNHDHISTPKTINYPSIPLTLNNYEVTSIDFNGQSTTKRLNQAGELITSIDNGGTLSYYYNNQGLQKKIKLAGTTVASFDYDIAGNQTQLIDANAGTVDYLYDAYGNLTKQTDAKGVTDLLYNNYNELVSKINPLGTVDYEYIDAGNGLNQVRKITHTNGSEESFQYDRMGRSVQYDKVIDNETYAYEYSYDNYGREQSIKYPSGFTTSSEYTTEGFLKKIKNLDDATTIWEGNVMNEKGQYTKVTRGVDLVTDYEFDVLGLPKSMDGELDFDYTFEAKTGNLSDWTDNENSLLEDFEYDNLNRITSMMLNQSTEQTIEYLNNGNIDKKGSITNYGYHPNKKNAVTSVEDWSSQIPDIDQLIEYNTLNQPSKITEGDYELELTYGADGQRMQTKLKNTGTLARTRTYLPNYEIQEFAADDREQQIHYIAGGDGLAAMYVIEDGVASMYYAHTNHLGSILKLTDESGLTAAEQSFDAWGRRRNASDWTYSTIGTTPDWLYRGYTGHEHYEEFGLINMNGRMYDPMLGRMLSTDNYVQDPTNSQSYNRYSYVVNNPLKYTDPSGEVFALALGVYLGVGLISHFSGNPSSVVFRQATMAGLGAVSGGVLGPVAGGAAFGGISGGISASQNNTTVYGGLAKGAFIGGITGYFSTIGGGALASNVAWGAVTGAVSGGIYAAAYGSNLENGILYGAATGVALAFISSGLEAYGNYKNGHGFRTNNGVIKNYTSLGQYDDAIDFIQSKYGLLGVEMAYDAQLGDYGVTDASTGNVSIGKLAFESPSMLKATVAHEYGHSTLDRVLDANGNFLNWKYPIRSYNSSNAVLAADGPLGYAQEIYNAGRMNISRAALTKPGVNPLWSEWNRSIGGSRFFNTLPKRFNNNYNPIIY